MIPNSNKLIVAGFLLCVLGAWLSVYIVAVGLLLIIAGIFIIT